MLKTFEELKKNFKLKPQTISIDNLCFRLHYRYTTLLLLIATILVSSRQYIGEHIKCISGQPKEVEEVINTFCFFTSTFTVIRDYDDERMASGAVAHPGVGSYGIGSLEPIQKHAYYQWVPFVLFGQAIMFHLTHILWKRSEGGRLKRLVDGLRLAAFSLLDQEVNVRETKLPSKEQRDDTMQMVRNAFIKRLAYNRSWSIWLMFCEILNVLNVLLQIYITNLFLGKQFLTLGTDVMSQGLMEPVTVLDEVFPKVTKCSFYKYGASGGVQLIDAMCIMALNVINEKIYIFLWFWFLFLFCTSCFSLVWRVLTIVLHARSKSFNKFVFSRSCPGNMNPWNLLTVTKHCNFTDWLFLSYLSKNIDGLVFKELFLGLAEDLDDKQALINKLDTDEESGGADSIIKSDKFD